MVRAAAFVSILLDVVGDVVGEHVVVVVGESVMSDDFCCCCFLLLFLLFLVLVLLLRGAKVMRGVVDVDDGVWAGGVFLDFFEGVCFLR